MAITFLIMSNNSYASISKDFEKLQASNVNDIFVSTKTINGTTDHIFRDVFGREAYFRGWNVSGAVKLISMGFKPFKNLNDAKKTFKDLRTKTGTNVIRYTLSWEGVHPEVDQIDEKYLSDTVSFIKEAIKNKIYIILDYHQDLYSRYLFHNKSKFTGNGAPYWIVPKELYPDEKCLVCFHWGMNNKLNKTIMSAYKNFWDNSEIPTKKGTRNVQTEFLWQVEKTLKYIQSHLTTFEFQYILGLNPMNEPIDGGHGKLSTKEWYKQKIWPFYFKVRKIMDDLGYEKKLVYGEPVVFWNTNSYFVQNEDPAVFENGPGPGHALNFHFYDAKRMSLSKRPVKNGSYINYMNFVRDASRKLYIPPFITEFGMWIENGKVKNQARIIKAVYQGLELSTDSTEKKRAAFYSPVISGTQWHWDIYHNQHQEPFNFSENVITKGDGWNNEDFSIVTNSGKDYTTNDQYGVERAFPRRCQGDILHFHYNDRTNDGHFGVLNWAALQGNSESKPYLAENRWFFMAYKGKNILAPSVVYLPPHFSPENLIIMTNEGIQEGQMANKEFNNKNQAMILLPDSLHEELPSGHKLLIWNKNNRNEDPRFILAIDGSNNRPTRSDLEILRNDIISSLTNKKSPIVFLGNVKPDNTFNLKF